MRSISRNVEVTFVNDDRLLLSLKCSLRTDLLMVKHMFKTDFPPSFDEIRLNRKHARRFLYETREHVRLIIDSKKKIFLILNSACQIEI